jgi:type I restriction enzyme S subunit
MSSEVAVEMFGGRWKRYPVYRDSGVEWLGKVPEGWNTERLKYCATLINEKVDGRESNLQYTGLENIESWTGRLIPSEEISTSEGQSNIYEPEDVLFGKLRPYLAKVLSAKEHGICTGELLVLRPKDVSQEYLFR